MTRRWIMLLVALAAAVARADDADIRRMFAQAGQAYDAGQFAESARGYEEIRALGYAAPELFFNLGNAYFKQGDYGPAVLNYRRAQRDLPRDPELNANLRFALQTAGALAPPPSRLTHVLTRLSLREWCALGFIAYWVAALLIALHIWRRDRPRMLLRGAAASAVIGLAALAGIAQWSGDRWRPERIVLKNGTQALFAPLENSTAHFALPPGSIVREIESSGPWVKVASGPDTGWIPESSAESVSAWHPGQSR